MPSVSHGINANDYVGCNPPLHPPLHQSGKARLENTQEKMSYLNIQRYRAHGGTKNFTMVFSGFLVKTLKLSQFSTASTTASFGSALWPAMLIK